MSNTQEPGRESRRPTGAGTESAVKRRAADASMTLLNAVINNPIDPGYAASARKREEGSPQEPSLVSRMMVVILAVILGLATTVAVTELRRPAPEIATRRAALEREITDRAAQADELEASNLAAQDEIDILQADLLGTGLDDGLGQVRLAAGVVPVGGPGLIVELSDADADAGGVVNADGIVRDIDLQVIVNGLWASGAEAISINDRRLTSISAIRNAGQAVLIDLQPVLQPYVIKAIGDSDKLQTRLARSSAGPYLQALRDNHRIKVGVEPQKSIKVEASSTVTLRYATSPGISDVPSDSKKVPIVP